MADKLKQLQYPQLVNRITAGVCLCLCVQRRGAHARTHKHASTHAYKPALPHTHTHTHHAELETHLHISDKAVGDFIIDAARSQRNVDEFKAVHTMFACFLHELVSKSIFCSPHTHRMFTVLAWHLLQRK